jgi:hypothetical protein
VILLLDGLIFHLPTKGSSGARSQASNEQQLENAIQHLVSSKRIRFKFACPRRTVVIVNGAILAAGAAAVL